MLSIFRTSNKKFINVKYFSNLSFNECIYVPIINKNYIYKNNNGLISNYNLNNFVIQKKYFSTTKILNNNKLIYTDSDEWLKENNENITIGLTKNAIEQLSDLVYIEFLHENGSNVEKDEELVIIESVKATNSIKAPFNLLLCENNIELESNLNNINNNPENFEDSWIIKVNKK